MTGKAYCDCVGLLHLVATQGLCPFHNPGVGGSSPLITTNSEAAALESGRFFFWSRATQVLLSLVAIAVSFADPAP